MMTNQSLATFRRRFFSLVLLVEIVLLYSSFLTYKFIYFNFNPTNCRIAIPPLGGDIAIRELKYSLI